MGYSMKFRPHNGGMLEDSIKAAFEFNSGAELLKHLEKHKDWANESPKNIKSTYYGYDDRINWDTYLIICDAGVLGYCNGDPFFDPFINGENNEH